MQLTRRGFLIGATAFGIGCGATRANVPATVDASGHWTTPLFGHAPTRALVWRTRGAPGRPLRGFFGEVYESEDGMPWRALMSCSSSERFWCGPNSGAITVVRGIAGLDPRMIGRGSDGRGCVTGPGCRAEWEFAGGARFRKTNWSLYVLPGGTWISMPEHSLQDLHFAANPFVPPPSDLEPNAIMVEQIARDHGVSDFGLTQLAGADRIYAVTKATFASAPGADVPALERWHLPDEGTASKLADDYSRVMSELNARYPAPVKPHRNDAAEYFAVSGRVAAEGASVAMRGVLPYELVAAYAQGG